MQELRHINITNDKECCGCSACSQICPKQCISMSRDKFGFFYPTVDTCLCINCGACTKVCPFISEWAPLKVEKCFAAINIEEQERLKSSSGGVFIQLAKLVVEEGGVVYGAIFNETWQVEHKRAETMDSVISMMGSKYVQSNLKLTYKETLADLRDNRLVLFTGTPCQISGLRHFLKADYPNLVTVEVVCHGVPSDSYWNAYLSHITKNRITSISFRDKSSGWRNYKTVITVDVNRWHRFNKFAVNESYSANLFNRAFIRNLTLRPSCFSCKCKSGKSHADLTIGDFWGIDNTRLLKNDNKGISCIICRTPRGESIIEKCNQLKLILCNYNDIIKGNPSIENSANETPIVEEFRRIYLDKGFIQAMAELDRIPVKQRIINNLKLIVKKILKR